MEASRLPNELQLGDDGVSGKGAQPLRQCRKPVYSWSGKTLSHLLASPHSEEMLKHFPVQGGRATSCFVTARKLST